MYRAMKKVMKDKLHDKKIERHLWNGIAVQQTPQGLMPIVRICCEGFNRSNCGTATGKWQSTTGLKSYVQF